jgi:Xaa-Pro aminopeptidase
MISMEPVLKRGYASWDRDVLPDDEYGARVEAVRTALRDEGLAALVVVNYSLLGVMVDYADIAYLSGLQSGGLLLVPRDGAPVHVGFGGGRELHFQRTLTWLENVISGGGKAFDVLREQLQARGIERGALGVAGAATLPADVASRFAAALRSFELKTFDAQLRALRAVKRPRELLVMRLTRAIVGDALTAGLAAFAAGRDNSAAMLEAERVARARKARDVRVLASMGGAELRPWEGRIAGRHAALRLWVAAQYQGYWAEAGAASPAPADDVAKLAVASMQKAARAGATTGDVAAAAAAVLPPPAFDSALEYGLGAAIGLSHDEGQAIRPGGTERLPAGVVLALRAHVASGAEPSLASTIVRVEPTGAVELEPLRISS